MLAAKTGRDGPEPGLPHEIENVEDDRALNDLAVLNAMHFAGAQERGASRRRYAQPIFAKDAGIMSHGGDEIAALIGSTGNDHVAPLEVRKRGKQWPPDLRGDSLHTLHFIERIRATPHCLGLIGCRQIVFQRGNATPAIAAVASIRKRLFSTTRVPPSVMPRDLVRGQFGHRQVLFEGCAKAAERRLIEVAAHQLQADRQAVGGLAHGQCEPGGR